MREFDFTNITDHCYHDGTVSTTYSGIEGDFPEDETERSGLVGFYYYFGPAADVQHVGVLPEIKDADIIDFDIKQVENGYEITLNCEESISDTKELKFHHLNFTCQYIICYLKKYKGFSYRNVYNVDSLFADKISYVDEKFFSREYDFDLGEGMSVHCDVYEKPGDPADNTVTAWMIVKNTLTNNGEVLFEHFSDPQHLCRFKELLHHRNGHRYYAYHTDLYGLSFFDVDTHEHYDYVPEGYDHDYRYPAGESFIITDIHYDPDSDLLACGGCYWAGTSEVFVMDFSHPLHYDPRAARLYDEVFSEDEDGDDFDFLRWEKDSLVVKILNGEERRISKDRLTELLNKKKYENLLLEFDK